MAYRKSHVAIAELLRLKEARAASGPESIMQGMLDALRVHLDMDIAFISEFVGDDRVFRFVSRKSGLGGVEVGDTGPLSQSYCQHVVDGELPELIKDASKIPLAADLAAANDLPVGVHLCVPLRLSDGSLYGSMCCFAAKPDRTINRRNLEMLRMGALLAADLIERKRRSESRERNVAKRIDRTIKAGEFNIVYQPIYNISEGRVIGVEALARFPDAGERPPSAWFDEADEIGRTVDLELGTIGQAVEGLEHIPDDVYLAINVSLETLMSGKLKEVLEKAGENRIVVELTEHEAVEDYEAVKACLESLGGLARLAVDDVGAGHSSMRHILDLDPDFIKLDISIVRDIDKQPSRSAFVRAMVEFAKVANASIVAEGVERQAELDELARLDADNAQGFHLCRPLPLPQILPLFA